jgi:hypothetical protein
MTELLSGRDCQVIFKSVSTTVTVDAAMLQGGWPGGQGVQWVNSAADERTVTYSKGLYGGILIWGSDEDADKHLAVSRNQIVGQSATMLYGGNLILTTTYERYTWASRTGGGPLIPLNYGINDFLYLSLRGLFTKEDELTLSGDALAPAFFGGFVAKLPRASNGSMMAIQTSM